MKENVFKITNVLKKNMTFLSPTFFKTAINSSKAIFLYYKQTVHN